MCGRVRLSSDYSEIKIRLKFGSTAPAPNFEPAWNVPPTGPMLVATCAKGGERVSEIMRWGLLPAWAKDIKIGYSTFNARADSVTTKPAFRGAWKKGQRCLVVTNGFYEWRKSDKQPFAIGNARKVGDAVETRVVHSDRPPQIVAQIALEILGSSVSQACATSRKGQQGTKQAPKPRANAGRFQHTQVIRKYRLSEQVHYLNAVHIRSARDVRLGTYCYL